MIAGPHEWTRFDVLESKLLFAHALPFGKLFGQNPARHRRVMLGRTEILTQREDVDGCFAQILHRLADLIAPLTHPEDDSGLCQHAGVHPLRGAQQRDAAPVARTRTRPRMHPLDCLEIVVQDLGLRFDNEPQRVLIALEIRNQHFDGALGPKLVALANRLGEDRGATVA